MLVPVNNAAVDWPVSFTASENFQSASTLVSAEQTGNAGGE